MESTKYSAELDRFPDTYGYALNADITSLKKAIAGASASSILGVGSGGSYTTASLLCELHELYTGRVSRPATPLEIICNPSLSESSPLVLISAEGKNPDALEVLNRARRHSTRSIHLLTNSTGSPLVEALASSPDVIPHIFPLDKKDGYLATNSLLLNAILIARSYAELDGRTAALPPAIDHFHLEGMTIPDWLRNAERFVQSVVPSRSLIITYSPNLRPIAIDLESKLAEGALLHCQVTDLRSFAHGRHLWLASRPEDVGIVAIIDPSLEELWQNTQTLFPSHVPVLPIKVREPAPSNLIAGLIIQMHLIGMIASARGIDPGGPSVPQFGRNMYYAHLESLIEPPEADSYSAERSKFAALAGRWPLHPRDEISREREAFVSALESTRFRAVVFDYDGTLCASRSRDLPPDTRVLQHIVRLCDAGAGLGIATGRGGSVQESLASVLDGVSRKRITLGLYNCGWIGPATEPPVLPNTRSEYLSHAVRLLRRLQIAGVPIEEIRPSMPHHISVRLKEGSTPEEMWFVIADSLRLAGLDVSSVVKSRHSIDILSPVTSKSRLVAHLVQTLRIDPYQILTIGDQGAWPGNDHSLLDHRFSLSVDLPSRRLDRGWKLAPTHLRDVDATIWYMERLEVSPNGEFRMRITEEFD